MTEKDFDNKSVLSRMVGAALLRSDTYRDVEHDRSATRQAVQVVILVSVTASVGGALLGGEGSDVFDIVFGVIGGVLTWVVWTLMIWMVGKALALTLGANTDWGQLARGTAFAQVPGIFFFLMSLPGAPLLIVVLVGLLIAVWQLAAMVVAVRLCYIYISTWGAFFLVLMTLIPTVLIVAVVEVPGVLLGIGAS